jgi:ferredoxin
MPRLRVAIDAAKCTGEGICVGIAPGVFDLNEDGLAEVVDPEGADQNTIVEAAASCPTDAITVVDEESGKQLAP